MTYRRQLNGLKGTALTAYGPIPTENVVTSLDVVRKYIGPQPLPAAPLSVFDAPDYWTNRGREEALVMARGTFVRFTSILNAVELPGDSAESLLRDELLSILSDHGYMKVD